MEDVSQSPTNYGMTMYYTDCKYVDPYDIETRFSDENFHDYLNMVLSDEMSEESKVLMERVRTTLSYLPDMEADFFDLYYIKHKSQIDIAKIFGKSQPTVHYRLKKARKRIKFVLSLPSFTDEDVRRLLATALTDDEDINIMALMYQTTCQSEVAKMLGTSQGKVRHRFMRSIVKLQKFPELETLTKVFVSISQNLTILKEVSFKTKPRVEYYVDL